MSKLLANSLVAILALFSIASYAGELPDIIENGLNSYKESGSAAAAKIWIKGSPIEGTEALSQVTTSLEQIDSVLGEYQSRDIFKKNSLGPRSDVYLITLNFKKGMLYSKFFIYKPEKGKEILQSFDFATEVDQVWPSSIVYGK